MLSATDEPQQGAPAHEHGRPRKAEGRLSMQQLPSLTATWVVTRHCASVFVAVCWWRGGVTGAVTAFSRNFSSSGPTTHQRVRKQQAALSWERQQLCTRPAVELRLAVAAAAAGAAGMSGSPGGGVLSPTRRSCTEV